MPRQIRNRPAIGATATGKACLNSRTGGLRPRSLAGCVVVARLSRDRLVRLRSLFCQRSATCWEATVLSTGAFLVFAAVLTVMPGPDFAVVTKNAFAGGWRRGSGAPWV